MSDGVGQNISNRCQVRLAVVMLWQCLENRVLAQPVLVMLLLLRRLECVHLVLMQVMRWVPSLVEDFSPYQCLPMDLLGAELIDP